MEEVEKYSRIIDRSNSTKLYKQALLDNIYGYLEQISRVIDDYGQYTSRYKRSPGCKYSLAELDVMKANLVKSGQALKRTFKKDLRNFKSHNINQRVRNYSIKNLMNIKNQIENSQNTRERANLKRGWHNAVNRKISLASYEELSNMLSVFSRQTDDDAKKFHHQIQQRSSYVNEVLDKMGPKANIKQNHRIQPHAATAL